MDKKIKQETKKIIEKAEKVNEKSVYLEDLKDANKSNSTKKAQVAVSNYKKWHKS